MGVKVRQKPRRRQARHERRALTPPREPLRRMVDLLAASGLIILTAPLLLLGIALVAVSGRPIFFGHERLGQAGVRFRCWKLRTMHPSAENLLDHEPELYEAYVRNGFKIPANEDPRITRIGRFLRRTYLDELPQLYNVLVGDMSLFGPRPIIDQELKQYRKRSQDFLRIKPGLFGEWTSLGRHRPPYPERARLELAYVQNRSVLRDLSILIRSIPAIIVGQKS
jgi:lipopolysaccharide/colanic/teichoic acid biosynthesis glycosyltransferase